MLQAIIDPEETTRLQTVAGPVMDGPNHLNLDWLNRQGWEAVPIESACYFVELTASRLANACKLLGQTSCYAIATEPVENAPLAYTLSTDVDTFLKFGETVYPLQYVLMPENREFAVLCTPDYELVAGPHVFVLKVLGTSITDARSKYAAFFTSSRWSEENRRWFESVVRRYEPFGA